MSGPWAEQPLVIMVQNAAGEITATYPPGNVGAVDDEDQVDEGEVAASMGSRQAEMRELVARVRRVGWPTRQAGGGTIVVTCPDDAVVPIHMSASDTSGPRNVLKKLNRHGLAAAEAEARAKAKAERAARIAADRRGGSGAAEQQAW